MHSEPKWVHMLRNPDADALKFWNCYYPTYLIGHLSPDWVHMLRNRININPKNQQIEWIKFFSSLFSSQNGCISAGMTDFIAALADLILPELMGGYAPEYVDYAGV